MADQQETKIKGPRRFENRVRRFVLAEFLVGFLLFMSGVALLFLLEQKAWGIALCLGGMWAQLSLMMWRMISYQISMLLEIAPMLKILVKKLGG